MFKKFSWLPGIFLIFSVITSAQQISIPRIEAMPNMPQPYEMRDWKAVAIMYDELVFDLNASGQHLPLTTIVENTINYPEHPTFGIQSYVGTNQPPGLEAINVIPSVVGATLTGIDKSNQYGYNWPLLCEEYFNRRPSENVYLNNPNASSGYDWWYETMPNIFFYQLNELYSHTGDFNQQFTTIADRWLEAVLAMGGFDAPWTVPYMNYRAFRLSNMTPLESGIREPEAAGAIGWILYNAFVVTGEEKYRKGAEWCMEFLSNWNENPAYELQLSYGTYAAARMNAEMGTDYDIEKLVNWCFDVGPLRNWGAVLGTWNGIDVFGLIGESQEGFPAYAFAMNGFEQAGALVPMVRYDDRFAQAIGKWMVNMANASRLFYSGYLPDEMEDNEDWTAQYDPESVIAYEALREETTGPYGTGDAMSGGWAQTNLGLYGSSHVGILGSIIDTTNVPGILQLDLTATDYYGSEAFPSYLFYNPDPGSKTVEVSLPEGNHDIYDAVTNQVILTNVSGSASITISPDAALLAVYIPSESAINYAFNKAMVQGIVIDYNSGQYVENYPPRIKALSIPDSLAQINTIVPVYCTAVDKESEVLNYQWYVEDSLFTSGDVLEWQVPDTSGFYEIRCVVVDEGNLSDEKTILVKVVEKINFPPEIQEINANPRAITINGTSQLTCQASDNNGDSLTYEWLCQAGSVSGSGNNVIFNAPSTKGHYYILCKVTDIEGAFAKDSIKVLVYDPEQSQSGHLVAWYEFDGSAWDYSGFGHQGTISNCSFVEDMHGNPQNAIAFNTSGNVSVLNTTDLNFQDGITVSFWINISQFFDREAYPISHGNWQHRWKVSIGEQQLRFTLNGENGIIDLDSESMLEQNIWYHIVGLYNGWDCLLYLNGELDALEYFDGEVNTTDYDLIFGQALPGLSGFGFMGNLDKVRIYNYGISNEMVKEIYEEELSGIEETIHNNTRFVLYPNPASNILHLAVNINPHEKIRIILKSVTGLFIKEFNYYTDSDGNLHETLNLKSLSSGIYILYLHTPNEILTRKFIKIQ